MKSLKMPKPGADTAARAGPTSSWTQVQVPGQHLSKACSARGHAGLAREQGQHHCQCSVRSPCRGTTHTRPLQQHCFYARGGQGQWGPDRVSPLHRSSASASGLQAGLRASPLGASGSMGAITIPAHHWHPGRSHHHGDVFLPQMPSPWEPPLLHRGAGTCLILPMARPGLGCVVFLFLL